MELCKAIHDILCREYGMFSLTPKVRGTLDFRASIFNFILNEPDIERVLDAIQVSLRTAASYHDDYHFHRYSQPGMSLPGALQELNERFREHGVGYQFEGDQIIRLDSAVVHQEIVRPALHFLSDKRFAGANAEFLSAHEHYRKGRKKECLVDCLKAFESTLKVICTGRNWPFGPTDTAAKLLSIVFNHHLLPAFLQSEFAGLRASLESGISTMRNRMAGHGQGATPTEVPDYLAAYLLHLTAASILLLVQAETAGAGA